MTDHNLIRYRWHGCRCIVCADANAAASWLLRSRKGQLAVHGPRAPRHGTRTEYQKHGCRCDDCRAAETEYRRRYRKTQR